MCIINLRILKFSKLLGGGGEVWASQGGRGGGWEG